METQKIKLDNIFLDPNNYRFQKDLDNSKIEIKKIPTAGVQKRISSKIKNDPKIRDLEESILFNDFIYNEIIIVKEIEDTKTFYVIEGNRRIATLKKIFEEFSVEELKENLREIFEKGIDVKVADNQYDEDILMGMRHVTGIKPWSGFSKAKLIVKLHEEKNYTLNDIAKSLGNNSVNDIKKRLYAYKLLEKMHDEGYDVDDISQYYTLFYEAIGKPNYRLWLEFSEKNIEFLNKENAVRFYSWITDYIDEEGVNHGKAISNPQNLRLIADILFDEDALSTLDETRMVDEAIKNSSFIRHKEVSKTIKKIYNAVTDLSVADLSDLEEDIYELLKKSSQTLKDNIEFIEFKKEKNEKE